jgi:hypothetical protein
MAVILGRASIKSQEDAGLLPAKNRSAGREGKGKPGRKAPEFFIQGTKKIAPISGILHASHLRVDGPGSLIFFKEEA